MLTRKIPYLVLCTALLFVTVAGNPALPVSAAPEVVDETISAGDYHDCRVMDDGEIHCWGSNDWDHATPPTGWFSQVSAGGTHNCAVNSDPSIDCWGGSNTFGENDPPSGLFLSITVGDYHSCGIKTNHTIACWGNNDYGRNPVEAVHRMRSMPSTFCKLSESLYGMDLLFDRIQHQSDSAGAKISRQRDR